MSKPLAVTPAKKFISIREEGLKKKLYLADYLPFGMESKKFQGYIVVYSFNPRIQTFSIVFQYELSCYTMCKCELHYDSIHLSDFFIIEPTQSEESQMAGYQQENGVATRRTICTSMVALAAPCYV